MSRLNVEKVIRFSLSAIPVKMKLIFRKWLKSNTSIWQKASWKQYYHHMLISELASCKEEIPRFRFKLISVTIISTHLFVHNNSSMLIEMINNFQILTSYNSNSILSLHYFYTGVKNLGKVGVKLQNIKYQHLNNNHNTHILEFLQCIYQWNGLYSRYPWLTKLSSWMQFSIHNKSSYW